LRGVRTAEIVALAALALGLTTAASEADSVIARESKPTGVNAHRGRVVWSSYDAKRKAYWLKVRYRGHVRRLPVRPRREPFDVDLGPDARGRTVAVYSRCRSGLGPAYFTIGMFGDPGSGRDCDIYEYRFATRREWRVKLPGMRATSEYFPTIWGGRIAFARILQREPGRSGVEPFLYYASLPAGKARQTRGGTRGRYTNDPGVWEGGPGPTGMDLRGDRLAFTWVASFDRCRNSEPRNYNESTQPELWVGRLG
jgi:hypothetical protein